jgi:hypothetical protein
MAEEAGEAGAPAAQQVLMIGGAMRSGTTVIHRALCTARNSNPVVSESWFLRDLVGMYRFRLSRFDAMGVDQFGSREVYEGMLRQGVRDYLRKVSATLGNPEVLILKHPELIRSFADLAVFSPGMLFLVVVRDPRDVIASVKRVRDSHGRDGITGPLTAQQTTAGLCQFYWFHYERLEETELALARRLMIVRYEDFMRSPRETVAEIGAFCGARYELDGVAEFHPEKAGKTTFDRERRTQDAYSRGFWSDLYVKPLSQERIGRFGETLNDAEIAEIEARLASFGRRFGYWS